MWHSTCFYGLDLFCFFFYQENKISLSSYFIRSFKFITFASSAGGLRNRNAATFASFKKICFAFF
jgi:hypothetical protein